MPTITQIEQAIDKGAALTWRYGDEYGARITHIALKGSMVRLFYNGHEQTAALTFSALVEHTTFNLDDWILYPPIAPAKTVEDFGLMQPELWQCC